MNIKQIWFILCMVVVLGGTVSCIEISSENQQRISVLLEKQIDLKNQLEAAINKHEAGKLTTKELLTLKDDLTKNIVETKDEVLKLKEEGVGYVEMGVAIVVTLISRGVPSKGPLGALFTMLSARRKED